MFTLHFWRTANCERMPFKLCNGGDLQENVVPRTISKIIRTTYYQMTHLWKNKILTISIKNDQNIIIVYLLKIRNIYERLFKRLESYSSSKTAK